MATIRRLTITLTDDGISPLAAASVDVELAIPNHVDRPPTFQFPLPPDVLAVLTPVLAQIRAGARAHIGVLLQLEP